MRALQDVHSQNEISSDMKKQKIIFIVRLCLGGASLGLALSNVIGSLLGIDFGTRGDLVGAGVGGGLSFAVLAKALHVFG
jgi:hypothetical protein